RAGVHRVLALRRRRDRRHECQRVGRQRRHPNPDPRRPPGRSRPPHQPRHPPNRSLTPPPLRRPTVGRPTSPPGAGTSCWHSAAEAGLALGSVAAQPHPTGFFDLWSIRKPMGHCQGENSVEDPAFVEDPVPPGVPNPPPRPNTPRYLARRLTLGVKGWLFAYAAKCRRAQSHCASWHVSFHLLSAIWLRTRVASSPVRKPYKRGSRLAG